MDNANKKDSTRFSAEVLTWDRVEAHRMDSYIARNREALWRREDLTETMVGIPAVELIEQTKREEV